MTDTTTPTTGAEGAAAAAATAAASAATAAESAADAQPNGSGDADSAAKELTLEEAKAELARVRKEAARYRTERNELKPALQDLECVDLGVQLSGVDQGSQDVVPEVLEPQSDAAQML
ncbi:hypothetical protein, partial [Corynebacterium freneyi]|uniref:hypothetical protein n=1 Tax=Corynebacterium freneyi TaxID=134034 RepID=UPI001EF2BF81